MPILTTNDDHIFQRGNFNHQRSQMMDEALHPEMAGNRSLVTLTKRFSAMRFPHDM